MCINFKVKNLFFFVLVTAFLLTACNKENAITSETTASSSTIAVALSLTASLEKTAVADSVYLLQPCRNGAVRDSIAESQLPASVGSYLTANYTPYTFSKAFAIITNTLITGYVAIIYYNDKPVGIEFDAAGNFLKVLEQREKGDLNNRGWHHGGRFGARGNPSKDTVSITGLPATVKAWFEANYPADTLKKAYRNRDSSYVVFSKNNALFANIFSAGGAFISRNELTTGSGNCNPIALADLPVSILSYLDLTYPNYVFIKAFARKSTNIIESYLVLIDANNTKYAVRFSSAGTFLKVKIIY